MIVAISLTKDVPDRKSAEDFIATLKSKFADAKVQAWIREEIDVKVITPTDAVK